MPWEPSEKWTQAAKEIHDKHAEEVNKAWGEQNERGRRDRVANALGFEKTEKVESKKVNNSKSPKM